MSDCAEPCDHCRPDAWHGCVRPADHSGYHSCQPETLMSEHGVTRRTHLTMCALAQGADVFTAAEAVASTAIEHPEWDMDEVRTLSEWWANGPGDSGTDRNNPRRALDEGSGSSRLVPQRGGVGGEPT